MAEPDAGMTLRPYQLLCAVCALEGTTRAGPHAKGAEVLARVRESPDMPLTLRCNAGDVFAYQDCGPADDTPGGPEVNALRDLEILHALNVEPGCTLPARIIFIRLLERIRTAVGLCGTGCPVAGSGCYERGRARGIGAIIPPRPAAEMEREKQASLDAMYKANGIPVRPHILVCAVCQYGAGTLPPYPEDNLPELLALVLKQPDTRITLVRGADWMMCAPCPNRAPGLNACVNQKGSGGLPNQRRDLRVLQVLGLSFGDTLPARDLFARIFERISGTLEICRLEHPEPSVWWDGCGAATADGENFEKGKRSLKEQLGC